MSFKNHNFQSFEQEEQHSCASNHKLAPATLDPAHRRASTGTSLPENTDARLPGHVRRQAQEDGSWEERKSLLMEDFDSFSTLNPVRGRPHSEMVTLCFNNPVEDTDDVPKTASNRAEQVACSCDSGEGASSGRTRTVSRGGGGGHRSTIPSSSSSCDVHNPNKAATLTGANNKTNKSSPRKSGTKSRSCSNLVLEMTDVTRGEEEDSGDFPENKVKRTRILQRELSRIKKELQDLGDLEMEVTFV